MRMDFQRKLPIPQEVKREFPLTEKMEQAKKNRDEVIRSVFEGQSDKFLLIIGPCSADHREPVLEYLSRLCKIQEQVSEKIVIIPRIYTNKPRTTGKGYKGMLHQPDPEAKPDMYKGIVSIRELHMAANPSVIVDTNHNNSGKKYLEQVRIAKDIVHSRNQNADIKKLVKGLMVESYLEDGAQGLGEHVYGKSITDPCLGWEKTAQLIFDIADKL